MSPKQAAQLKRCTHCGAPLTSRFCADCGSPVEGSVSQLAPGPEDGWRGIASDFFPEQKNGILSVIASFARHPVRTIIRLTDDPHYRSHWAFMTACLGAQLTLTYLILPRLMTAILGVPQLANSPSVITSEIVQYTGIAILLPVQYYLCQALGTIARSPRSYAKLCALSLGYSAVLSATLLLIFFAVLTAVIKFNVTLDYMSLGTATTAINVIAVLTFVSWSHKIFWGMKWPVAVGVTVAIAALSWAVVYPGLGMLAQQTGLAKMLDVIAGDPSALDTDRVGTPAFAAIIVEAALRLAA